MTKIYFDKDISTEILKDKIVAIIGFGNQGKAHAMNLKDSGVNIICGLREGSKKKIEAENYGIPVYSIEEASKIANIIMILIPDEFIGEVYGKQISPYLTENKMLMVCHGFAVYFKNIVPPKNVDITLISPKGPGKKLREAFKNKKGLPGLVAIHQDYTGYSKEIALAYGKGIGVGWGGIMETTFKEETVTDLFGEQAVLCGGVPELMKAGFETLVNAGYQPEMAYIECISEMKLIVDLLYEVGYSKMRKAISNTAEYGGYLAAEQLVTDETREKMKKILENIENGNFAKNWINENRTGLKKISRIRETNDNDKIEQVTENLLKNFKWLDNK